MPIRANRVVVDRQEQVLEIEWGDQHQSRYVLDGLRRACPCAGCRGGHDNMGGTPDPELFLLPALQRWEGLRLEAVGHYALRFIWDDGHSAGIYTWQWLRDACPCELCRSPRS